MEVLIMDRNKFTFQDLYDMTKQVSESSLISYEDLPKYDLFLSQVIDFLNDKFEGENYTNNIVQNYIKSEVITKPEDGKKRGYTKLHLVQLALLGYMRPILTTEEIKKVFKLAFNEINEDSDDIISWEKAYKAFSDFQKESFEDFMSKQLIDEDKLHKIIEENNLKSNDRERILVFLVVMTLIAQASAIKKLVQKIVDEYEKQLPSV
jgi:spore cortex formation protein SpoVR/YcgB (stage V sporulation)